MWSLSLPLVWSLSLPPSGVEPLSLAHNPPQGWLVDFELEGDKKLNLAPSDLLAVALGVGKSPSSQNRDFTGIPTMSSYETDLVPPVVLGVTHGPKSIAISLGFRSFLL